MLQPANHFAESDISPWIIIQGTGESGKNCSSPQVTDTSAVRSHRILHRHRRGLYPRMGTHELLVRIIIVMPYFHISQQSFALASTTPLTRIALIPKNTRFPENRTLKIRLATTLWRQTKFPPTFWRKTTASACILWIVF